MQIRVALTYRGDMHCETTDATGKSMSIDAAANRGKPDCGLSPTELLALAQGG
jgi:uncharacterized OsmC-like protein